MNKKLEAIRQNVIECTKCELSKTRIKSVPGKGNFQSDVIFEMENHLSELLGKNFQSHLRKQEFQERMYTLQIL
jgi:hypothetical protein